VARQRALHTENSGFATPTPGHHIFNICCSLSYFGFSVTDAYALWLASSQNETQYLAFQAFVFERTYLMKVIQAT
jgi:hypothetical protein